MPSGANAKREREYEELKQEFKEEGRYQGREAEVAARIVNKQRAEFGETQEAKAEDRAGRSPDRNLPLKDYDHLTLDQVTARLGKLSPEDIRELRSYEQKHKNRKTLLAAMDRELKGS